MDGLPLGHHGLLPAEYNYHQAMAQHAAAVSASNNSALHANSMSQLSMMPAGLNLSMNANNQSMANISASLVGSHHLSHGHLGNNSLQGCNTGTGGAGGGKLKHKKPKVNKDGVPAPKRATTAYINFTQWYREDQKKNGRQIPKIGEFGKECAGKWNHMTDEEKQPFLEIAAQDRERYRKEMAIFKPARDANKPKRPGTAFMLFMADLRKEMAGKEPEGGVAALAKLGGERWRGMTDEEKRKYIEKQGEEKLRYEQCMEEYRKTQSILNMAPVAKQPRLEEPQHENSSDSSELPTGSSATNVTSVCQIPQLTQNASNSNSSSPSRSNANTPASEASSASPPPPTLSPGPNAAASGNAASPSSSSSSSSMSALSSLASPMALTQAMAMGYAQHTLTNFAHASGMLVANPNFSQPHAAHNATLTSSPYLPAAGGAYNNQPHLPGPYAWN